MRILTAAKVTLALCVSCVVSLAQESPSDGKTERRVEIRRALAMKPLKVGGVTVTRLIDSVILEHEGVLLYCDSAYVYQENNSFDAYGYVRIEGENSLIEGTALYYEGSTKNGRIVGSPALMVDEESGTKMWTDFLFFNSEYNTAHFVTGGRVESPDYRVTSRHGYYASTPGRTTFAGEVVIRGEDVNLVSDSVELYRKSGKLNFFNRTRIYQDSTFLYGDSGVYERDTKRLQVQSNVSYRRGENTIFSDYLEFDQQTSHALAHGRTVVIDSTGDTRLYCQYLELWQEDGKILATQSPMAYSVDSTSTPADTLYLRADTLFAWRDTVLRTDTLRGEQIVDTIGYGRALHAVRAYSHGQQAVADSMYYNGRDSTVTMYRAPDSYLWMNDVQTYAKSIVGFVGENRLDSARFTGDVFVAQQDGETTYNQINGQRVSAILDSTGIRFVRIREDGRVIFFMRDEGKLIGVNKVSAPGFNVWMENNAIQNVSFYTSPKSDVIPYKDAQMEDKVLPGFAWNDSLRPKSKEEIIPRWIGDLTFYAERRAAIKSWEALDSAIFAIPWESGTSKIPDLPKFPDQKEKKREESSPSVE